MVGSCCNFAGAGTDLCWAPAGIQGAFVGGEVADELQADWCAEEDILSRGKNR